MPKQYFYRRLHLYKIPYKVLLAYHGMFASTNTWIHYSMNTNVSVARNEMYILNLNYTFIQIRRAINALNKRISKRHSFLTYLPESNFLRLRNDILPAFLAVWVPGSISNYRKTTKALVVLRHYRQQFTSLYTTKQKKNTTLSNFQTHAKLRNRFVRKRFPRLPKIPSISMSFDNLDTWLNETHSLRIPSIQLCDTQSNFSKITFPITLNPSIPIKEFFFRFLGEIISLAILGEHNLFSSMKRKIRLIQRRRKVTSFRRRKYSRWTRKMRAKLRKKDFSIFRLRVLFFKRRYKLFRKNKYAKLRKRKTKKFGFTKKSKFIKKKSFSLLKKKKTVRKLKAKKVWKRKKKNVISKKKSNSKFKNFFARRIKRRHKGGLSKKERKVQRTYQKKYLRLPIKKRKKQRLSRKNLLLLYVKKRPVIGKIFRQKFYYKPARILLYKHRARSQESLSKVDSKKQITNIKRLLFAHLLNMRKNFLMWIHKVKLLSKLIRKYNYIKRRRRSFRKRHYRTRNKVLFVIHQIYVTKSKRNKGFFWKDQKLTKSKSYSKFLFYLRKPLDNTKHLHSQINKYKEALIYLYSIKKALFYFRFYKKKKPSYFKFLNQTKIQPREISNRYIYAIISNPDLLNRFMALFKKSQNFTNIEHIKNFKKIYVIKGKKRKLKRAKKNKKQLKIK